MLTTRKAARVKFSIWALVTLLVFAPVSVIAFYNPVRVAIPEAFGMDCERNICVDDPAQRTKAELLYNAARDMLEVQQGLVINDPKITFCSTERCRDTFGLDKKAGVTFGAFGVAIAPRGWKKFYVAHELVHHWQADHFGSWTLLKGEPWLIEGMAYALSNDPRTELHSPFQSYRQQFIDWRRLNRENPLKEAVGEAIRDGI